MADLKNVLGIKMIGEDYFVMQDNSFWIALEVQPIDLLEMKQDRKMKILNGFQSFLESLPFNIEIAVRTCNDNIESRLNLLFSKASYNIKQNKDDKLLHDFENFFDKFSKFCRLNCPITRKLYIILPYNLPKMYLKPAQIQTYLKILKEREEFVVNKLTSIGLKNVSRLDKKKLESLFRSYTEDYVLVNGEYYLAEDWQKLVTPSEKEKKSPNKQVSFVAQKLQPKYAKVKSFINERGVVFDSQLREYISDLSSDDISAIIEALENDPDISITEKMYHQVSRASGINLDVLNEIKNTQKIEASPDYLKMGNYMVRGLVSAAFPNYLSVNFLKSVILEKKNLTINLHIAPGDGTIIYLHLKRKMEDVEKELNELHNKGMDSEELNYRRKELSYHLENISKNNLRFFDFSMSFLLEAANLKELDNITSKTITMLHSNGVILKAPINYQMEALQTTAPTGTDSLHRRPTVTTSELLMHVFPFFLV